MNIFNFSFVFNPLNAELNPICHLLALLEARHIFHVSGLRGNLTFTFSVTQYDEHNVKLGLWAPVKYGEIMLCQARTSRTVKADADFR
jgi:hypothetical protein